MIDVAPNPLSELTWGRAPASPRRRRAALRQALFPSAFYVVLFGGVSDSLLRSSSLDTHWSEPVMISAYISGMIALAATLLARATQRRFTHKLHENRADYRMIGLAGNQVLWGLAGPRLVGALLLAIVYLLSFSASFVGWALAVPENRGDVTWIIWIFVASLCVSFVSASWIEVALWTYATVRPARLGAIVAVILASPMFLAFLASLLVPQSDDWLLPAAYLECVAGPAKLIAARWFWRRACSRLETESIE